MPLRETRRRQRARRRRLLGLGLLLAACAVLAGLLAWRPELALRAEFARLRWAAGAQRYAQEIDGQRWVWLEAGEGPPLLLVHGFTGSKENWLPLMAQLRGYRLIAPDLPGWGESQRQPGADYGYAAQAARLDAFVRQRLPGQSLQVVGHSMGGGIVALWAAQHPAGLRELVLLDAAGVSFDNDFSRAVRAGGHPFEVRDAAGLRRQLDWVFQTPPWIPWPADRALVAQRRAQSGFEREVLQAIAGDPRRAFAPAEQATAIAVPTLLLWCRDDRVIDASASDAWARRLADARQRWLDGCNHMPMMEQPAATASALADFLSAAATAGPVSADAADTGAR